MSKLIDSDIHSAFLNTVQSLGYRLQRIEFHLSGNDSVHGILQLSTTHPRNETVQTRLAQLEGGLAKLASKSRSAHDVLSLRAQYPEIFLPLSKTNEDQSFTESEKLAVITSCATLYSTTASQLMSIKDLPVPVAETSAYLISLQPRLAHVQALQNSQAKEIADLRLRTASVLQRWYEIAVLIGGECWTEWEDRLAGVEKVVRREEAAKSQDDIAA